MKTVVIFAGHDDKTWETLGAKGVRTNLEKDGVYEEYDTNILLAAGAVRILRAVPGLTVYFPQEKGRDMTLKERVDYANSMGADFMIDIHSNAAASRTATGAAAFYWKGSTSGKRAADIYADLLREAGLPLWSNGTFASNLEDGWSGFYMLHYSHMPAILLENFFFTTRSDLQNYLLNPTVQRVLMEIVAETVLHYFGMKMPTVKPAAEISQERDYLMYGDRGEKVSEAKKYLKQLGYQVDMHDYYNAEMKKAVMAFQLANGLKDDGVYGNNTKAEMNKALKELAEVETSLVKEEPTMAERIFEAATASLAGEWEKAHDLGITDGANPDGNLTRAQGAALIVRALENDKIIENIAVKVAEKLNK